MTPTRHIALRAPTEAAMAAMFRRVEPRPGRFVTEDEQGNDVIVAGGGTVDEGFSIIYLPSTIRVLARAVVDENGEVITPAVIDRSGSPKRPMKIALFIPWGPKNEAVADLFAGAPEAFAPGPLDQVVKFRV